MRNYSVASICFLATFPLVAFSAGQTVTSVYNRDTHEPFQLKDVSVESTVVGPIVRTSTLLTYANPYKSLTEATLNFEMPAAAALGGFAYFYGKEYVPGRLMDKNMAWFIYTAITSRNRDPGIMEQWSPTTYHCQIFPIRSGHDLRIRLWTVGVLQPANGHMALPMPSVPRAVSYYSVKDGTLVKPVWTVRSVKSGAVVSDGAGYSVSLNKPITAVAQRFKDGRIYVTGLVRSPGSMTSQHHTVVIEKAFYESAFYQFDGTKIPGADVTDKVNELLKNGEYSIRASNGVFGDPLPMVVKRLRINYALDGKRVHLVVPENSTVTLLTPNGGSNVMPSFAGLRQTKTIAMDQDTVAFAGWMPRNRRISAQCDGSRVSFRPEVIAPGSDTARFWAQQMLAGNRLSRPKDVLAFSMKYGVPSNATALLAVPSEEMQRYRTKEKEFLRAQAEQRRTELAAARKARSWAGTRNQNWNAGGGGDPEIRVVMPGARSVEAILPDRRVIELDESGDEWGGNFEIPANAPEGLYRVRIVARMFDGTKQERSWTYSVDRTPPVCRYEFLHEGGKLILQVVSEPGLPEVSAYSEDGSKFVLVEIRPGVYRVEVPVCAFGRLTVIAKDRAGNKGTVVCSLPR